jgi:hypothetical protein
VKSEAVSTPGIALFAISVGIDVACAIVGGGLECWGQNGGRLGDNNSSQYDSPLPCQVVSSSGTGTLTGVTAVWVGGFLACAVASGNVCCWGSTPKGSSEPAARPVVPRRGRGPAGIASVATYTESRARSFHRSRQGRFSAGATVRSGTA